MRHYWSCTPPHVVEGPGEGVSMFGDGKRDPDDAALFNHKLGFRSTDAGYDWRYDLNDDGKGSSADIVTGILITGNSG